MALIDNHFLKMFLDKNSIPYPQFIIQKTPQDKDFQVIDSVEVDQLPGFLEIPPFEHDYVCEDNSKKHTLLWLSYPEQIYLVAAFPNPVSLDRYTVNMLYHLLIPTSLMTPSQKPENPFESIVLGQIELSAANSFETLFIKILEQACSLVKADAGMLWFYDNEIQKLVCRAYNGSATEQALSLRLDVGEGLVGKAYLQGMPKLYATYEEILPDIADYTNENKIKMLEIFGVRRMDAAYVLPIFVNKQIECILVVYRMKGHYSFSLSDIEILKIFAELIQLGMTEGKDRSMLRTQLGMLQKCNDAYSKLTTLSVNNSGIVNIVRELKKILGISVLVINLMTNEQYPRHKSFDRELTRSLTQMHVTASEPFLIESKDRSEKHCVYPILAGGECLGYLLVLPEHNEIQINRMILEIGRMVIALELSKTQSMLDIVFKRAVQHFLDLINLNNPLDLAKKCSELGMDSNADYAALIFTILSNDSQELQATSVYRLIDSIKRELAGYQKIVFSAQEKITVLLSNPHGNGIGTLHQQIDRLIDQFGKNENRSLCAGMGSFYSGANNISRSFREAQNALMYQLSKHGQGLLRYSDMGVNQLFINLTAEEAAAFLSKIFAPLRENSKQAEYLEATLIAYVESNYSVNQTANKLYIHTNTLYQRLKKIESHLGISLKKPDDLLQVQLACYLKSIYPDIYHSIETRAGPDVPIHIG